MSAENNKAVVRRFFEELCNQRKLDVADDIFTLNHTYHDPSNPQVGQGPNDPSGRVGLCFRRQHQDRKRRCQHQSALEIPRPDGNHESPRSICSRIVGEGRGLHQIGRFCADFGPVVSGILVSASVGIVWWRFLAPVSASRNSVPGGRTRARNPTALAAVIPRFAPRQSGTFARRAANLFRIESEHLKLAAPYSRRVAEPLDADANRSYRAPASRGRSPYVVTASPSRRGFFNAAV